MSSKPKTEYRVGVGASSILMVLVVLALTAVSLLAFRSAMNTRVLTQRNTDMTVAYYEASARAQQKLAAMDALLTETQEEGAAVDEEALLQRLASVGMEELRIWAKDGGWAFSFSEDAEYDRYIYVEGLLTLAEQSRYQLLKYQLTSAPVEDDFMEFQLMGG